TSVMTRILPMPAFSVSLDMARNFSTSGRTLPGLQYMISRTSSMTTPVDEVERLAGERGRQATPGGRRPARVRRPIAVAAASRMPDDCFAPPARLPWAHGGVSLEDRARHVFVRRSGSRPAHHLGRNLDPARAQAPPFGRARR